MNLLRFTWSWALDHYSYKVVYGTLLLLQIFLNFTIFFIDKNWYTYALWIWLFVLAEGGHYSLLPNILKRIFGSKATQMYGWFGSYPSVSCVITIYLQKWFLVDGEIKTFYLFFIFYGCLNVLSLILIVSVLNEKPYVPLSHRNN